MGNNTSDRRDRLIEKKIHDTYRRGKKLPEPTKCPTCSAVFKSGRWTWETQEVTIHEAICPACLRIKDDYAAGFVEITGGFYANHHDDIDNLIRNTEQKENVDHPLERIMSITKTTDGIVVSTTGVHLARRIGKALFSAHEGNLSLRYADAQNHVRIAWER